MKFLRVLIVLLLFTGVCESRAQITCDFNFQNTGSRCAPYFILDTASETSSFPITERRWYLTGPRSITFDNGQLYPTFNFLADTAGTYCLKMWSQNSNGDTCSITKCIDIANRPVSNFTFSPVEGCAPLTVSALCNSTAGSGTITSIVIDFGCFPLYSSNVCSSSAISHTYTCIPGVYSPVVIITNSFGCTTTDTTHRNLIRLIPPVVANFTADTTYANCATSPLTVNFTADSAGPNMTYRWYVNSVLVQTSLSRFLNNRMFAIDDANCYDVKLVVTHPSGCGDSLVKNDYICVRSVPQLSFTQNATTGCVDAQSPFTLTLTSTTIGAPPVTWALNGPGGPYPIQTGQTATYTLTLSGTYTITASATFGPGCADTLTQQVLVLNQKPVAFFTGDDLFGCSLPHTVSYTATSCANCIYQWNINGIGPPMNTTTQQNPVVTYNSLGAWNTTLTVTDNITGCTNTLSRPGYITLRRINPTIGQNRVEGCSPVCVDFTDATNYAPFPDPIASVCWSFTGPSVVAGACQTPLNRCFTTPGCYNVKMKVTSTTGCVDSVIATNAICVGTPPACVISATPTTLCFEQEPVVFSTNCDTFGFDYFHAVWGDGDSADMYTQVFEHFYQDTGNLITYITPYRDSCAGPTFTFLIRINPPIAAFTDSSTCFTGDTVFFRNRTAGATSYLWTFCDSTTSTLTNPFKIFSRCDTCTVTLAAYNSQNGCTHQKTSIVNTACDGASFSTNPISGCAPFQVFFTNTSPSSDPTFTRWYFNCVNCSTLSGCANVQVGNQTSRFFPVGNHCAAMRNRSSSGCIDTAYLNFKLCQPIADFTSNNECFPQPICFTYNGYDSLCTITRRRWTFGDTSQVDTVSTDVCHSYSAPGSYQVTLFIENDMGCTSTITKTVIVSDYVSLNYSVDSLMCPGMQHCVTNNSTGSNLSFEWIVPNGMPDDTLTSFAPCFSFSTPGYFWVNVNISSNNLCTTRDSVVIHSCPPDASGYISTDFIPCPNPNPVQFVSTATCYDSLLIWNFGDQIRSNLDTAAHIYGYPGNYPICLTVISRDGCSDTKCIDTIVVEGPYGSFTVLDSPGICACKDTVHFSISTVNSSSLILLYGCNQGFCQTNPITPLGTPANPTIINCAWPYCLLDSCQPQLIFGDTSGCIVFDSRPFVYLDSPIVNFTFNSYGACVTGTVCFRDSTTYHLLPYQSYTVQRLWDFGDGFTDTAANPCHTYPGPGTYNPRLYIWSNVGCFDSMVIQTVFIPEFPQAGYFADDSFVCAYTPICFHDTSSTDTLTSVEYRVWDFGDGSGLDTSYLPDICHTYTTGGYYRVTLCVYDSLGCPDCDSSTVIHVIDNPVADAGADRIVCYGVTINLNGSGGTSCLWSPAIVSDPSICNPTVQLTNDATLVLVVTDQYQCTDSDTLVLTVARVFADFNAPSVGCLNDSICVTDASSNINGSLFTWTYDFGSIPILSDSNGCHKYSATGSYDILQTVTDDNGCVDTTVKSILINPSPTADFAITDPVICSNYPVCVTDLSSGGTPVYTWAWNFGTPTANATGSGPHCYNYTIPFQPNYTVTLVVTDQNNCADSATRLVTVQEAPTANFSWNISCENQPMPLTNTSNSGDAAISNYEWTLWLGAPAPVIDNNASTSFLFPVGFHDVQLIVTDLNGCADTIIRTVETVLSTDMSVNPGDTTICLGTSVDYTVTGLFTSVYWSPPIWVSDPNAASVTITPQSNVSYIVSAVNGTCEPARDTISISVIQPVPIDVMANPDRIILGLSSNITSQIPGQIDSIVWTPDSTLDCRDCPNPIATPTQTTTYYATIYYSQNGVTCTNTASVTIEFLNSCDDILSYLPNTFTPNGDGQNDVFMIRGIAGKKINYFRIFDRWGKLMFESTNGEFNDPRWGWDGTDREGKKLNPAVFVYTYEIVCVDGEAKPGKGNVSLVR